MRTMIVLFAFLFLIVLFFSNFHVKAEEGMYLPNEIDGSMMEKMKKMGLQLSMDKIYNREGTGIMNAVVGVGATASFVSPKGLILTNHHVAFGAVQRISTAEKNYIEDGFLARTFEEEIPAPGYQVYVPLSVEDVTDEVLSAAKIGAGDYGRYMMIEKKTKEIIRKCEEKGDVECDVRAMNYGMKYYRFTYLKIKDVRIVYVPARSIGEYGGEVDNWMWPRHTGDFSFLRAYVAPDGKPVEYSKRNVPYKPASYLRISMSGVKENDFTLVVGFPGRTSRRIPSEAIEEDLTYRYPFQIRTIGDMIRILEGFIQEDKDAAVKLAGTLKGLYNSIKNSEGMLEGLKKSDSLGAAKEREKAILGYMEVKEKAVSDYASILKEIGDLYEGKKKYREKSMLMGWMERGLLSYAMTINKWALEKVKKDADREPGYQERDLPNIELRLKIAQKSLVPEADRIVLEYFLRRAAELPAEQRIEAVDRIFRGRSSASKEDAIADFLHQLYSGTKLISPEERIKMLALSRDELLKLGDPFVRFASELEREKEIQRKRDKEFQGAFTRLVPLYLKSMEEWQKQTLYPDANGTLRFSYGQVKGYSPRDAVSYRYITSLSGLVEKNTGREPFNSPGRLLEAYHEKDYGRWIDAHINDVPVDFLSTNDSTGGNSGSPVLNGKGELVGVLFDGTYESLFCDYNYNPSLARSIHVDVRYILWVTEKVDKATNVIDELTLLE